MRLQFAPKSVEGNCLADCDLGGTIGCTLGILRIADYSFFGGIDGFLDRVGAFLCWRRRGGFGGSFALAELDHGCGSWCGLDGGSE